jgi:hypothetical protein
MSIPPAALSFLASMADNYIYLPQLPYTDLYIIRHIDGLDGLGTTRASFLPVLEVC